MTTAAKKQLTVPERFVPRFWDDVDGRSGIAKEIRRRYEELKTDAGADSAQKDLLVRRAVFIALQLETMECTAAETGEFNFAIYTQAVNALSGLLTKLGLERHKQVVADLQAYVRGRT